MSTHNGSNEMGKAGFYSISHTERCPAVNVAARRGTVAAVTGAAPVAQASGGVPFAEGAAGFLSAAEERGGRAGLHRKG